MTALGRRWMRNPSVLQPPNHSMATDCTTKAVLLLNVHVKSKIQGKTGGLCVCVCVSSDCSKPRNSELVCVKKVIRPPVQTALSANNNGYFLLLSLSLSLSLSPSLLSVCAQASWQIDVQRLHLLIVSVGWCCSV